jgi:hypothetical protein
MVVEVRKLDENKLFKIATLNLKNKTQDWSRRLEPLLDDWKTL